MAELLEKIKAELVEGGEPSDIAEALFSTYIDGTGSLKNEQEKDVADISRRLDGAADGLILGEYEAAARRAGFYAGLKAAAACLKAIAGGID